MTLLRVLALADEDPPGPEYHALGVYLEASGQVKDVVMAGYHLEQSVYDACRGYLPDVVICRKSIPGLVRVTRELRMPVLVLNRNVSEPLWYTTSSTEDYRKNRIPNRLLMYEAVDPDRFYCQNLPRNIKVSSPPHEYVDYLKREGVDVYVVEDEHRQHWKVNDVLNRSRICLTFSPDGLKQHEWDFGQDEFKITACGAMLMSAYASAFFEPNVDMIKFDGPEDLLRLVRFYFANPRERARIAKAGHYKSADIWTVWHTWAHVFERMALPVPDFILKTKAWKLHHRLIGDVER
ncbi:MAG: glycosyltransferase [Patescibacteria group bacterium]|nr:glycosyltransferase [Patescibacteria group bacterium]